MPLVYVTPAEAEQFALILSSGVPHLDAVAYMRPLMTPEELKEDLPHWLRDSGVKRAILKLQRRPWEEMSLEEKLRFAIDKHYTEAAYYLYSRNYATLSGTDKAKADTCRQVIEAKLAGMAGKMDSLTHFFDDLMTGKVVLPKAAKQQTKLPDLIEQ